MNGLLAASTDSQSGISLAQLEARIRTEFRAMAYLRREFPMLTEGRVSDVGLAIHSLGLNYLAAFGRELGCPAVTEFPLVSEDSSPLGRKIDFTGFKVRPDVVWFNRQSRAPILLAEFERYDEVSAKRRLIEKAENLVLAHHLSPGQERILLLALWTFTGVTVSGLAEICTRVRSGFRRGGSTPVNGLSRNARFLVATFLFARQGASLTLKEIQV
jgi:hypothetical protein